MIIIRLLNNELLAHPSQWRLNSVSADPQIDFFSLCSSNGASNYGYNPFGNDSSANPVSFMSFSMYGMIICSVLFQSSPPPPPPVSPSAVYIPAPSPPPVYQAPVYTPSSPPAATRQPSYPSDPKETSTRVDLTAFERQQAELAEREKRMNERQGAINPSTPITRKRNQCFALVCFYT